jgi:predicted nucleic acid-binding protein
MPGIRARLPNVNGTAMQRTALDLIARLPRSEVALPVQVLRELFNVLTLNASRPGDAARAVILSWHVFFA